MPQISGKEGKVTFATADVAHLRSWTINFESDIHSHAHSDSAGWEEATQGIKRWSGEFTIEAVDGVQPDAVAAAALAGTSIAFEGFTDKNVSTSKYAGNIKLGGNPSIEVNIESGDVQTLTYPFFGHGALAIPTDA